MRAVAHVRSTSATDVIARSDYPYAKFFERSGAILNYSDTCDEWCELEETDLDDGSTEKASIGQLLVSGVQ